MLLTEDDRVIAPVSEYYNAELIRREDETDDLAYFWVRLWGDPVPFEPGQYLTLGVIADGRLVQRPYSVASSPRVAGEGYEFYVRLVPILHFTTLLWRLPVGHGMRLIGPKGRFMLEPDDRRTQIFVSTGTGIAPFISMIRTQLRDGKLPRTVLAHGVSYVKELGFRRELERYERDGRPITYVPTISRPQEPENAGWAGKTGRVETILDNLCDDCRIEPDRTVVYICGNPDMIVKAEAILLGHGLPEPHIKKELYWPKSKEPRLPVDVTNGEKARGSVADLASEV
ncbi:MAG: FAD-binding oxidoreductase [Candidatus Limnocylindrales bacterium]